MLSNVQDLVKKGWIHSNDPNLPFYQRHYMELSVQTHYMYYRETELLFLLLDRQKSFTYTVSPLLKSCGW